MSLQTDPACRILALKEGHDGCVAFLKGPDLLFSVEAEKDSNRRFAPVGVQTWMDSARLSPELPDVLAHSGWSQGTDPRGAPIGAGYSGLSYVVSAQTHFGLPVTVFNTSHERSHILCAYGMSPFPQGVACYCLLWEGHFGAL